jgi:hypothetical protein
MQKEKINAFEEIYSKLLKDISQFLILCKDYLFHFYQPGDLLFARAVSSVLVMMATYSKSWFSTNYSARFSETDSHFDLIVPQETKSLITRYLKMKISIRHLFTTRAFEHEPNLELFYKLFIDY